MYVADDGHFADIYGRRRFQQALVQMLAQWCQLPGVPQAWVSLRYISSRLSGFCLPGVSDQPGISGRPGFCDDK